MNRIGKIELDFRMENIEFARALYGRWENFYSLHIENVIERVLQKHDIPSANMHIDQLDLDLGSIREEKLEEYFPVLLKEKLEEALRSILRNPDADGINIEDEKEQLFHLLCRFLLHGMFPWRITNRYTNISHLFLTVLEGNARRLKLFLLTYGHYTGLRQRLVYRLNDPELEKGIRLVAPNESLFICSYIQLLRMKYKELERPLIRESDYRKVTWLVVYSYLLDHNSSWFNRKSFLSNTLESLASSYNLSYEYLLTIITYDLERWSSYQSMPVGLIFLLRQLKQEWDERQWDTSEGGVKQLYELLKKQEQSSQPDLWHDKSLRSLERILSGGDGCRRFLSPLSEKQIYKLVDIIIPAESELIKGYAYALDHQQTNGALQGKAGSEFRILKWQIIFPVLLENRGVAFNRKYFVSKVIQQVSAHYNLKTEWLLEYICSEMVNVSYLATLQVIFQELWRECRVQKEKSLVEIETLTGRLYRIIKTGEELQPQEQEEWIGRMEVVWFRRQLLPKLSEKDHRYLVEMILPGIATFILAYAVGLERQRINGALEGKAGSDFRIVKWDFLYAVLVATRKHVFNKSYFVETTLARLSSHYNVTSYELLSYFYKDEIIRTRLFSFELLQIIEQLYEQYTILPEEKKRKEEAQAIMKRYFSGRTLTGDQKESLLQDSSFLIFVRPVLEIEQQIILYIERTFHTYPTGYNSLLIWLKLASSYKNVSQVDLLHTVLIRILSTFSSSRRNEIVREIESIKGRNTLLEQYWRKYRQQISGVSEKENRHEHPLFHIPDYSYIENAGMVLLAPFLPALFSRLCLLIDGSFPSSQYRARAVAVLQYAVYGDESPIGESLLLNYLLTGSKEEEALMETAGITVEEKEVIHSLLKSLLQHWSKLKGTSVAGLREAFLQRSGKIEEKGDAWHLLMEQKSYDMLLDTIPWNYHTIKFSWMEKPIYVK